MIKTAGHQKIYMAVIAGCLLLLAFLIGTLRARHQAATQAGGPVPAAGETVSAAERLALKKKYQISLLNQPWGRDPFSQMVIERRPEEREMETEREGVLDQSAFLLTGIIYRGKSRVAIINRYFVREGDTVQGVEVLRIEEDHVVLKRGKEEVVLRMGPV